MARGGRWLRGGARALAGVVVLAAAAAALVAAHTLDMPSVDREPLSFSVDTTHDASRTLVCPGAFSELGADPEHPQLAVPAGSPMRALAGAPGEQHDLVRDASEAGQPEAVIAPLSDPLGAAQVQRVDTGSLRGLTGSACVEPVNEQWLLGGESTVGVATTLDVMNPGDVAASVTLTVFDEEGEIDAARTAGAIVAPGAAQTLSLNGFAPDSKRLAVRVVSTGAPVTATLGIGHEAGLEPFAVSAATRQTAPQRNLVIAGVTNTSAVSDEHSDAGEGNEYPVVVRALAPGGEATVVHVSAVDRHGKRTELGDIELAPHAVGQLSVPMWPSGAEAITIEADAPVIASARGYASAKGEHDYEWFAPAPELPVDTPLAIPTVDGARLVLVNTGTTDADVEIAPATGKKATRVTVPAGAIRALTPPDNGVLTSDAPIHAGVRVVDGGDIAGYPIIAADARDGSKTVYTR